MKNEEKALEEKCLIIKQDLRQLRKLSHSIEAYLEMEKRRKARLELLKTIPRQEVDLLEINKIEKILKSINVKKHIEQASSLEEKYMRAIDKLDPLDKTIILEGYINGKAYWKLGKEIGYSTTGIQNRINVIIRQIAKNL